MVCFMIIALLTRLLEDELHWKDVCVKAIVFAVLVTVIRVKRKCGYDIKTHLGQHKKGIAPIIIAENFHFIKRICVGEVNANECF